MKSLFLLFSLVLTPSIAQNNDDPTKSTARVQDVCRQKQVEYGDRFIKCSRGFDSGIKAPSASYQPAGANPLMLSRQRVNDFVYQGEEKYINRYPEISNMSNLMSGMYNFGPARANNAPAPKKTDDCWEAVAPPAPQFKLPAPGEDRIEKGYPVAFRVADLMCERFGKTSELCKYFSDAWLKKIQPPTPCDLYGVDSQPCKDYKNDRFNKTNDADGSCHIWAKWAVDEKVIASLEPIKDGIICDPKNPDKSKRFPLSKGDLKEAYYRLYSVASVMAGTPDIAKEISTPAFFTGDSEQTNFFGSAVEQAMDYNLGLAHMGVLGAGSEQGYGNEAGLDPEKVFDLFKNSVQTRKEGVRKGVTIDRDHGAQVWNQSVLAVVVTEYKGPSQDPLDYLSSTDFESVGQDPSLETLKSIEANFMISLASGHKMQAADRARFKALTGTEMPDVSAAEQGTLFAGAKKTLFKQHKIQAKGGVSLAAPVYQDLTVIYGDEHDFGSNDPDRVGTRSFRFASVKDAGGNTVRSTWAPSEGKLSDICDGRVKEKEFVGFSGFNAAYECCKLSKGRVQDYPVFTSAVPPRYMDIFDAKPSFRSKIEYEAYKQFQVLLMGEAAFDNEAEKAEAIRKYGPIKAACPSFEHAVKFANAFRNAVKNHAVSAVDRAAMLDALDQAEFLDDTWLKAKFCPTTGVAGFDELKQEILARVPSFCQ